MNRWVIATLLAPGACAIDDANEVDETASELSSPASLSYWAAIYSDGYGWNTDSRAGSIQYADLNGDGRDDVCGRGATGPLCSLSTGTTFSGPSLWLPSEFTDANGWGYPYYEGTIRFPDVNGDGRADICGRASHGVYCAISTGTRFAPSSRWISEYSDAAGWLASEYYWGTIRFPDLNGDGRSDICGRASGGVFCALSNGSSFGTPKHWTSAFSDAEGWHSDPSYWKTIQYADLDGDGRDDVCGRSSGGMQCALSTGTAFGPALVREISFSNATGWNTDPSYWETIRLVDVTGDGRADVCGRGTAGIACGLWVDYYFTTATTWIADFTNALGWNTNPSWWRTIEFPDINGDGKHDVCSRSWPGLRCGLAAYKKFNTATVRSYDFADGTFWGGSSVYYGTFRYPDLDGDGDADFCARGTGGLYCSR
jgi:hypothetical protein